MTTRNELKVRFSNGKRPSEEDFAALIDSTINFKDDALEKQPGETMKIYARSSTGALIEFKRKEGNESWTYDMKSGLRLQYQGHELSAWAYKVSMEKKVGGQCDAMLQVNGGIKLKKGVEVRELSSTTKEIEQGREDAIPTEKAIKEYIENALKRMVPVGSIQPYAGEKEPEGWMLCDGRGIDKHEYAELYNVIGGIYGEEGGQFNIPNTDGAVLVGDKDGKIFMEGESLRRGGRDMRTIEAKDLPKHNHSVTAEMKHKHNVSLPLEGAREKFAQDRKVVEDRAVTYSSHGASKQQGIIFQTDSGGTASVKIDPSGAEEKSVSLMPKYVRIQFIIKY